MIEINNLATHPVDKNFLKKVLRKVLKGERKNLDLSIALVSPERIRKLNKKYRGENQATDVLAFGGNEILYNKYQIPKSLKNWSELVICPKEVKKNAKIFGQTFKRELANCLIHGILHLLGYNHEKHVKKAREIEKKQNYYLKIIKV